MKNFLLFVVGCFISASLFGQEQVEKVSLNENSDAKAAKRTVTIYLNKNMPASGKLTIHTRGARLTHPISISGCAQVEFGGGIPEDVDCFSVRIQPGEDEGIYTFNHPYGYENPPVMMYFHYVMLHKQPDDDTEYIFYPY